MPQRLKNNKSKIILPEVLVGSRGSPLALIQIEEVKALLEKAKVQVAFKSSAYQTAGDQDKTTSLVQNTNDYFFTDTLDQALLEKEIDLAIHSAKDLPKKLKSGLAIFALTKSEDATDCFVGKLSLEQLKPGAKVGTSSLLRQQQLKNLYPHLELINIRGTIQERLALIEQGMCDGIIVATIALKRLGLQDRIKNILPWEGAAAQGQLAVVGRSEDKKLAALFEKIDARKHYGKVILVGAGPGDPELITLKGIEALRKCDCVFYDYLVDKSLLNYAKRAEKFFVGKRKGQHTLSQAELSRRLKNQALSGKNIVRLKGGDPFIFGRGAEELEYLRSFHIEVEVVPGVSSATAIPASLQIPLTGRGVSSSVAFLSAHTEDEHLNVKTQIDMPKTDTLVFLMGLTKLDVIVRSLLKSGWHQSTPIILISKGTCLDQKILSGTIFDIQAQLAKEKLDPPVLIIVGKVVNFWDPQKIKRNTFLYTGTHVERYEALGEIVHLPMIEIKPPKLSVQIQKKLLDKLMRYDVILLTSYYAVKHFFDFLEEKRVSIPELANKDFVIIGQRTAGALRERGVEPKYIAQDESSEGMLEILKKNYALKGMKFLIPRSSLPNPFLKTQLKKRGAAVDEIAIYENVKPKKRPLPTMPVNGVIFTSPSTVSNFLKDYATIPKSWKIYAKGLVTQKALQKAGYTSEVLIRT